MPYISLSAKKHWGVEEELFYQLSRFLPRAWEMKKRTE